MSAREAYKAAWRAVRIEERLGKQCHKGNFRVMAYDDVYLAASRSWANSNRVFMGFRTFRRQMDFHMLRFPVLGKMAKQI